MLIIYTILSAVILGFVVFSLFKSNNPKNNNIIQKKKKKLLLIITIVIVSFIGIGIILSTCFKFKIPTSFAILYEIIYYDESIPGSKYDISVQKNNKIEITTTHFCSAIDCEPTTEKEIFNYSKDNLEKLKIFINNNFSNNYVEVHESKLTYDEYIARGMF